MNAEISETIRAYSLLPQYIEFFHQSMWTAVHVVTKRTRRVCEGDYYIYIQRKSTVMIRSYRYTNRKVNQLVWEKERGKCKSKNLVGVNLGKCI